MGHKTLIGGTGYEISGGKVLAGATAYNVGEGKTLINGSQYDIPFTKVLWLYDNGVISAYNSWQKVRNYGNINTAYERYGEISLRTDGSSTSNSCYAFLNKAIDLTEYHTVHARACVSESEGSYTSSSYSGGTVSYADPSTVVYDTTLSPAQYTIGSRSTLYRKDNNSFYIYQSVFADYEFDISSVSGSKILVFGIGTGPKRKGSAYFSQIWLEG